MTPGEGQQRGSASFQITPENPVGKEILVQALRKHNSRIQNAQAHTKSNYGGNEMGVADRYRKERAKNPIFKQTYDQKQKRKADDLSHKKALQGLSLQISSVVLTGTLTSFSGCSCKILWSEQPTGCSAQIRREAPEVLI